MKRSPLIIGLTGGIASGKTTAARLLVEQGVPVIDADEVARALVEPGQPALDEIVAAFGTDILDPAGRLDRGIVRTRVFSVPGDRRRLERILHPRIKQEMRRRSAAAMGPYRVLAIPLLLETSGKGIGESWPITRILVVDAPVEQQIQRACRRDGTDRATVEAILLTQAGRDRRLAAAQDVITNDRDLEHLRDQVMSLHHRYLGIADNFATMNRPL
uniref:Dephospho-CoA kinase n=1 Tax=Candidatus Kentrum eta TaxID=2126337 RepID=A0A450USC7_9GAMM|nr:MAG: dephospho-CoA kinase [Candidatus Kentron sp. H]VFJ88172.1 MAG: dephospho-CoA kinase [Candidatus Kentron sp. H]VFJ95395.1 MAG: dephospho-CoA kinase [Candidatus Kentron sp. H]